MIRSSRLAAYSALAALTIPGGIIAHLFAEIAGLGYRRGFALLFSGLHLYLAALAVLSPIALFVAIRRAHGSNARQAIASIAASSPFQGGAARFFVLSFVLQFGFFLLTQFGEGCPLRAGHLGIGLLAATAASAISALAASLCKIEILLVAAELFSFLDGEPTNADAFRARERVHTQRSSRRFRALLRAAANLPPPRSPTTQRIYFAFASLGDACPHVFPPLKRGLRDVLSLAWPA